MSNNMFKNYDGTLYAPIVGANRMPKFTDIWDSYESFREDRTKNCPSVLTQGIESDVLELSFWLLYSRYGNSTIASSDVYRFKVRLWTIMFEYTPTWHKRLNIQKEIRSLTAEQISTGSMQIYNTAENPSIEPSTDTSDPLPYINRQNVAKNKKGVLESYALLWELLKTDVTEQYLNKFKELFVTFANTELELIYEE